MLYSDYITKLRSEVGDTRRRVHVDWIGDGTTTVFQLPDDCFPVYDLAGSYLIKLAGVTKTETTDFTLDKEAGTLVMLAAPGNGVALTFDGSAVYLQDTSWLQVINDTIYSLGDDFWKEFVDTTITTTASALSISLASARPKCIAIYEFQHRVNSSENWQTVETYANWRYDRENNTIYVGRNDVFSVTGELLRIRGLEGYTMGAAVGDTLDVQTRFHTILEYGCLARYYRWRYKHVIQLISKMSTESTRTPLQELIMLSDRFDRLYESEKVKLKPQKPPRTIPRYLEGGGRP